MKAIVTCIFLFTISVCFSQKSALVITNLEKNKVKVIKENRRIKITTISGGKLVGRLKVLDERTIRLRGVPIALSEIIKIKRHPLIGSIGNAVGFVSLGMGITVLGAGLSGATLAGGNEDASRVPLYIGIGFSIGALYASTQPINILDKGYSINKECKFSIQIHSSEKPLSLK